MADPRKQGEEEQPSTRQAYATGKHQDKQAQQKNPEKQTHRAAELAREAKDDTRTGEKRTEDPRGKSK